MTSHSSEMTATGLDPGSISPQAHVFCSSHLQALSLISMFLLHAEPWTGPASLALPCLGCPSYRNGDWGHVGPQPRSWGEVPVVRSGISLLRKILPGEPLEGRAEVGCRE